MCDHEYRDITRIGDADTKLLCIQCSKIKTIKDGELKNLIRKTHGKDEQEQTKGT